MDGDATHLVALKTTDAHPLWILVWLYPNHQPTILPWRWFLTTHLWIFMDIYGIYFKVF